MPQLVDPPEPRPAIAAVAVDNELFKKALAAMPSPAGAPGGMSRQELAEALNAELARRGSKGLLTDKDIGRYIRGETRWPRAHHRTALRTVLGVAADRDLGFYRNRRPATSDPQTDRLRHALDRPGSADLVTVAYLREAIQRVDTRYDRAPSLTLLGEASQQHARAEFLCAHAPNGLVRRDLLNAVAESAILMGQLVWDGSQRRDCATAARYFKQSIEAAKQIGYPLAEARALLRMSFVALYGKRDPRSGLELAAAAGDTGIRSSEVIRGLSLLHVAEAYAMRGHRRSCEKALAEAESHMAHAEPSDAAWDLFSPTQVSRLAGSCYLFLGEHARSEQLLQESLGNGEATPTKSSTITAANLSLACIHQRKVDEAVAALNRAIDGIAATRGGGGINLAFTAGRMLHRWRQETTVREVQDRLWELMATEGGYA